MPTFSRAMAAGVSPRYFAWSTAIGVSTATLASITLVASQAPPIPTSTTAASTGASAKAAYAIATTVSKKESGWSCSASTRSMYGATSLKARTNCSSLTGSPSRLIRSVMDSRWGLVNRPDAQAGGDDQRLDHPGRRRLAVGAGEVDRRVAPLRVAEHLHERLDAVEGRVEPGLGPTAEQRVLGLGVGLGQPRLCRLVLRDLGHRGESRPAADHQHARRGRELLPFDLMRRVSRAAVAVALLLGVYLLAAAVLVTLSRSRCTRSGTATPTPWSASSSASSSSPRWVSPPGSVAATGRGGAARRRPRRRLAPTAVAPRSGPGHTVGTRAARRDPAGAEVNAAVRSSAAARAAAGAPDHVPRRTARDGTDLAAAALGARPRARALQPPAHRPGGITYRGREALTGVVDRFGERSLVGRTLPGLRRVYLSLTAGLHRQQELEADDVAAEVAGRDAAAAALCRAPRRERRLGALPRGVRRPGARLGQAADRALRGLPVGPRRAPAPGGAGQLPHRLRRGPGPGSTATPRSASASPPPRAARRRRRAGTDAGDRAAGQAERDLFDLQEWMYRATLLDAEPWSVLLHGHEPAEVRARAEVLYRAAEEAGARHGQPGHRGRQRPRATAGPLGQAAPDGRPPARTSGAPRPSWSPPPCDEALMSVAGRSAALAWDAEPRSSTPPGQLDSRRRGRAGAGVRGPGDAGRLAGGLGVGLDYVPEFPAVDAARGARGSRRCGCWRRWRRSPVTRHLFLVVLNHGVLLRRGRTPATTSAWWTGGTAPGRRCSAASSRSPAATSSPSRDHLAAVGADRLGHGRARRADRRPTLTFTCTDGSTWT